MIQIIPDERIAKIFHMDADLMSASCFQPQSDQTVSLQWLNQFIMCDGSLAILPVNCALYNRAGLSAEWCIDTAGRRRDCTGDNREACIFPVTLAKRRRSWQDWSRHPAIAVR